MSQEEKEIEAYDGDLFKIVEQLESCDYQCDGGPLNNNVAFLALKKMAARQHNVFMCKGCGKLHKKSHYCIAQNAQGYDVTFTCECKEEKLFKGKKYDDEI